MSRMPGLGRDPFVHDIPLSDASTSSVRAMFRDGVQSIAMGNANVTLSLGKPGSGETELKANVVSADPEGSGSPKLILDTAANMKGYGLTIINAGAASEELLVRDSGDTTTVVSILGGQVAVIVSDGTNVKGFTGTQGGSDDFGSAGVKADVVAESTAAAGVTVDGLLVKDGAAQDSQGDYLTPVSATVTIPGGNGAGNAGDLNSTPVTLVAAQGANKVIIPLFAEVFLDYGTAAYNGTVSGNLTFKQTDASGAEVLSAVAESGFANASSDQRRIAVANATFIPVANTPLVAHAAHDWYNSAGDSPLIIKVFYRVIDVS